MFFDAKSCFAFSNLLRFAILTRFHPHPKPQKSKFETSKMSLKILKTREKLSGTYLNNVFSVFRDAYQ